MNDLDAIAREFVSTQFNPDYRDRLQQTLSDFHQWSVLIELFEEHGLAPLVYDQIKTQDLQVETDAIKILKGLTVRHRRHWQALQKALFEIASLFRTHHIDFLCLKGAALSNMLYPAPSMRPMCDLDILVAPGQATQAQQLLRDAGFDTQMAFTGYLKKHHHLPAATRRIDQELVMVELHTQALSPDMRTPIDWDRLSESKRPFTIDEQRFYTLGHLDMLRHLCLHTFTRIEKVRLIGVVDMIRYATVYKDEIDWDRVKRDYPFVLNAFRCLQLLVSLPTELRELAPPPAKQMSDVGKGMVPLQDTIRTTEGIATKLKQLLWPPQWWTHVFYNVPPEKSLFFVRIVKHPALVLNWLFNKSWHELGDKLKGTG
ncbi:MAG: nucleotidyltransferase family protein [Arenicellales bacterium]|nr:nucleotidyltransferase family protein [Arenicellales bacterium]